ncbi:O-antigen ligase family protein [Bdellovibrio sp. HCB117]|uniref:O-antigen ligase family protein n=1 Tax=Bdellovibrio sp. HCB117 TaxID=3394359 RepID=UPI0039B43F90
MSNSKNVWVSSTATILVIVCFFVSLFSRNLGEYSFDIVILFVLFVTFRKQAPWSWKKLYYDIGFYNWLYLFYFWILVTLLLNPPIQLQSFSYLPEFLWIPALPIFSRIFSLSRLDRYFAPAFAILTSLSMICIIAHYFLMPANSEYFGYPNRLQGTFSNINFLAHSYFLVFLLALGLFVAHLQNNEKGLASLLAVTVITVFIALLLTFTRTIWFSIILSIPILFFFANRKMALRVFLSLCLLFGAIFISDIGGARDRITNTLTTNPGDTIRLTLWQTSFKIFLDNPVVGVGYMNNKRDILMYLKKYGETNITTEFDTHSHNEILSFLAGTGIVGTLLYLGLFVLFFLLGVKTLNLTPKKEAVKRGLLLGAIVIQPAFLIAGLADNNFEIHAARNWLVISWAILIWLASEKEVSIKINKINGPTSK